MKETTLNHKFFASSFEKCTNSSKNSNTTPNQTHNWRLKKCTTSVKAPLWLECFLMIETSLFGSTLYSEMCWIPSSNHAYLYCKF
jgi:hypothetical protein